MEYGLSMGAPTEVLALADKAQNTALRGLLSVGHGTSIVAMQKLTGCAPMVLRAKMLQAKFVKTLDNLNDDSIPAHVVWKNVYRGRSVDDGFGDMMRFNQFIDLDEAEWDGKINEYMRNQEASRPTGIGMSIGPFDRRGDRNCLDATLSRSDSRIMILWRAGNVVRHQECGICGEEMSRVHAFECCEDASRLINGVYTRDVLDQPGTLIVDKVLNYLAVKMAVKGRSKKRLNQAHGNPYVQMRSNVIDCLKVIATRAAGMREGGASGWKSASAVRNEQRREYHQDPRITEARRIDSEQRAIRRRAYQEQQRNRPTVREHPP
jgi:hypothetical protein